MARHARKRLGGGLMRSFVVTMRMTRVNFNCWIIAFLKLSWKWWTHHNARLSAFKDRLHWYNRQNHQELLGLMCKLCRMIFSCNVMVQRRSGHPSRPHHLKTYRQFVRILICWLISWIWKANNMITLPRIQTQGRGDCDDGLQRLNNGQY